MRPQAVSVRVNEDITISVARLLISQYCAPLHVDGDADLLDAAIVLASCALTSEEAFSASNMTETFG